MKKLILITIVLGISALTTLMARTFHIEKAAKAWLKDQPTELQAGMTLDEQTKVNVKEGGVLIIVDKQAGKRWLIRKKFSGKIGSVAKDRKSDLCTTTKALFYTTYSKPKPKKQKTKQAGMTLVGGSTTGIGIGTVIGKHNDSIPIWESDTTYRFLDDIATDSITFFMVE